MMFCVGDCFDPGVQTFEENCGLKDSENRSDVSVSFGKVNGHVSFLVMTGMPSNFQGVKLLRLPPQPPVPTPLII